MSTIENMINEEMVQDVVETVVEVQPSKAGNIAKNGLYALAGIAIWEGGKFVVKKVAKLVKAKKAAAEEAIEEDFEDQIEE